MLLKSTYVVGIAFAVSIFAVTLFTGSEEIRSECVCDSSTPAEALEEAGAVFMGVVVEKGRAQQFFSCDGPNLKVDPPVSSGGSYPVKLQVSTVWKGRVRETMIVTAGGGCGYEFSPGVEYLVYTRGSFVSVCGATVRASKAHEHFKVLGRGSTPEPGTFGSMRTSSRTHPTCPTATPTITPTATPTPVPTLTPTNTPMSPQPPTSTGSCNILAESNAVPLDAAPLALIAGIAWFGIRRRWRR